MVSKRNNKRNTNRKKAEKVVTPEKPIEEKPIVEKPKEEKKPELTIEDIKSVMVKMRSNIIEEVVNILRPDLDKKFEEISKQVATEMQDLRSHLEQPATSGNGDHIETPQTEEEDISQPPIQSQESLQGLSENPLLQMAMQLLSQLMRPAKQPDSTESLLKMMMQTQARQNMSNTSFDDWFGMEMKKDMARKYLNKEVPESVVRTQEHFMKPIRTAGDEAYKAEQKAKQERENHE